MTNFLIYSICCIVFTTVYIAFAWKGIKKKLSENQLFGIAQMFLQGETLKSIKKKVLNWYTAPFLVILWCVISPVIAPIILISKVRSLFFRKPRSGKPTQLQATSYDPFASNGKALNYTKKENFEQPKIAPPGFGIDNPNGTGRTGERPENNE